MKSKCKKLKALLCVMSAVVLSATAMRGAVPVDAATNAFSRPAVDDYYKNYVTPESEGYLSIDNWVIRDCRVDANGDKVYSCIGGIDDCHYAMGMGLFSSFDLNGYYAGVGCDFKLIPYAEGRFDVEVVDAYGVITGVNRDVLMRQAVETGTLGMFDTLALPDRIVNDYFTNGGYSDVANQLEKYISKMYRYNAEDDVMENYFESGTFLGGVSLSDELKAKAKNAEDGVLPIKALDMNRYLKASIYTHTFDYDTAMDADFEDGDYDYDWSEFLDSDGRAKDAIIRSIYMPETMEKVFFDRGISGVTWRDDEIGIDDSDVDTVPMLTDIKVQTSNKALKDVDGVLVDDTTNTLLYYPMGKGRANALNNKDYLVIDEAENIGAYAFDLWFMDCKDKYIFANGLGLGEGLPHQLFFDVFVMNVDSAILKNAYAYNNTDIGVAMCTVSNKATKDGYYDLILDACINDFSLCYGYWNEESKEANTYLNTRIKELIAEGTLPADCVLPDCLVALDLDEYDFKGKIHDYMSQTVEGDVNMDGTCGMADMVHLSKYLVSDKLYAITMQSYVNGDVTEDGVADNIDVSIMIEYLAGGITSI